MKNALLYCLLFSIASITAQAQTYVPFPTTNTVWRERFRIDDESPYTIHYYGLKNGDTILDGMSYHKLYKSTDTLFDASELIGGIREDDEKKVYFRTLYPSIPSGLLYDFSLQVGDSVQYDDNMGQNNWRTTMHVIATDSVNIGGVYHRRIKFDFLWTNWIEGVGNGLRGLLWYSGTWPNNGTWNDLICFGRDGNWVYHNPASATNPDMPLPGCDEALVGIAGHIIDSKEILFYPQPVVTTSQVSLKGNAHLQTMMVYDVTGRKVKAYEAGKTNQITISRSGYLPGIYYYRLYTEEGKVAMGKFVVR
ncbi:T9SS type A sorting domain-containing protein [Taibaiella koreensis]|uniref:T9SS type A sorting domain-containing protein n=1 Tax=Taibaiella koreensis TaxID=1268548 RepID=UPI000E5A0592|nr:T9SS type A sorting domain-containing protein [Taibaiella koreensis]